jgi:hypothetical protein
MGIVFRKVFEGCRGIYLVLDKLLPKNWRAKSAKVKLFGPRPLFQGMAGFPSLPSTFARTSGFDGFLVQVSNKSGDLTALIWRSPTRG